MNEFQFLNTNYFVSQFEAVQVNPYKNYSGFQDAVRKIIASDQMLREQLSDVVHLFQKEPNKRKIVLIRNCPLDRDLHFYDVDDSVFSKYELKRTFVGEIFLEVIAQTCELPILSYTTRNNGDPFQDVYAQRKYFNTQTQKTDSELYFHNDRTAHKVRADVLCLLGMRSDPRNIIHTKYVHGEDILSLIDDELHAVLRQPFFVTPFDLISQDSNQFQINSEDHPILIEEASLRYYDTRTTVSPSAPDIAWRALAMMKDALTKAHKLSVAIQAGDLFIFPNLQGLHSRDKSHIADQETARQRYLLKTYNFWNNTRRDQFAEYYVPGRQGLIDDAKMVQFSC